MVIFEMDCEMNLRNYRYSTNFSQNTNIQLKNLIREWPNESGPKHFKLSDKSKRLLQIFFDEMFKLYYVEMLLKTLFMN